jgi:hypothetical protein
MKRGLFSATCRSFLILFIAVFGVLYLVQTSSVSSRGYELSDLEGHIHELERETRHLEIEISKYRSVESIQERLQGMDMVAADSVEYVSAVDQVVVRR